MAISMLKIRRPLGRLIFNMGIAIPGKTVFLIETAPCFFAHRGPAICQGHFSSSCCFLLQVLIQVPQKGCVITWDFDILKGDVTFTVLRCRRTLMALPHEHHISGAVGGIGSTQYMDKHMTVGVDLSIVEPPLVCRDGDSIQVHTKPSSGKKLRSCLNHNLLAENILNSLTQFCVSFQAFLTHRVLVRYYMVT